MLTHDRSELMDAIRRRMQGGGIAGEIQQAVFSATGLFERGVAVTALCAAARRQAGQRGTSAGRQRACQQV
jgi:phosphate:Na+ symporter